MKKNFSDPTHCVVCGLKLTGNHKCPKRTLAGILAAERRVENWYDPEHPSLPPGAGYPSDAFRRRSHA